MVKKYYELTKSGLVFGNLITVIAGYLLASRGTNIHIGSLLATLIGIALVMASGCVFNNYIDRDIDAQMDRTKNRVLVKNYITKENVFKFGGALGIAGFLMLLIFTNILTTFVAAVGFFFYVYMYSLWWKRRSEYGAAVGAVAGAIPPVVGYCAASNSFDMGAVILFFILLTWQMPHFFAIAIRRESDYAAAGVPVMPIEAGIQRTKVSIFIYIIEFIIAASLLAVFGYTGLVYLIIVVCLGLGWLSVSIKGFSIKGAAENKQWARQMFFVSLIVMVATFVTIAVGALA